MKVVKDIQTIRRFIKAAKEQHKKIGFVPTMGYLHAGHAALLKQSKRENDVTVLSIFVNPKQFGPNEDFKKYPRDQKKDELLAKKEKVDIIFHPSVEEMYPVMYSTNVEVEGFNHLLCGKSRPGHFKGVATVVAKLLNIVSPNILYLGQKDAQQIIVLSKMIQDLNFSTKIKIVPTVREKNGLAMSSRNSYLNESDREEASILNKALIVGKQKIVQGERNPQKITHFISKMIKENTSGRVDYIECVDAQSLAPLTHRSQKILIALAVWFGPARLIDNILIKVK